MLNTTTLQFMALISLKLQQVINHISLSHVTMARNIYKVPVGGWKRLTFISSCIFSPCHFLVNKPNALHTFSFTRICRQVSAKTEQKSAPKKRPRNTVEQTLVTDSLAMHGKIFHVSHFDLPIISLSLSLSLYIYISNRSLWAKPIHHLAETKSLILPTATRILIRRK